MGFIDVGLFWLYTVGWGLVGFVLYLASYMVLDEHPLYWLEDKMKVLFSKWFDW